MMVVARDFPIVSGVPEVTTAQMIEVDRLMEDEVGISLVQMMENAGRALAIVARARFLGGSVSGKKIVVLAGPGGNGGGALTAARRLAGWGAEIDLGLLRAPDQMQGVPKRQLVILQHVGDPQMIEPADLGRPYDLIIDGLIGYSLRGSPHGRARGFIEQANSSGSARLSLDVPSGFDANRGSVTENCFKADATLTLALPKHGMARPENREYVGDLFCADIGVPKALYRQLNPVVQCTSLFDHADIVELLH